MKSCASTMATGEERESDVLAPSADAGVRRIHSA